MTISRNSPCSCGSGRKYKQCCGRLTVSESYKGSNSAMLQGGVKSVLSPSIDNEQVALSQYTVAMVVSLFNAGRYLEMEMAARHLTVQAPEDGMAWFLLGVALLVCNQNEEALAPFHRALVLKPNFPDAHSNLGNALQNLGRLDEAIASYQSALAIKPDFADAHNNLGNALNRLGRQEDAVASYQRALEIQPDFADACFNLGNTFKNLGRMDEAIAFYQRALEIQPNFADALNNMGNSLQSLGRLEESVVAYRRAMALQPNFADALLNLGNVLQDIGRLDEAIASYRRVLEINPDLATAHGNLGNAFRDLGRLDEAMGCYRRALAIQPDLANVHLNLGNALQSCGRAEDAIDSYQCAVELAPEKWGYKLAAAINLPIVAESRNHISYWRKRYSAEIDKLFNERNVLDNPLNVLGAPAFYLAYHDENDLTLMNVLCRLFRLSCPDLNFTASKLNEWREPAFDARKIRVGFLSEHLCAHTIGKLYQGLIRELDRERFEVVVLHTPTTKNDSVREQIDCLADHSVTLPYSLFGMQLAVAEERLDVLFYPDIGMHPASYFLAYARLAPVQVVSWGHPDSTGIDTIDYFLSADSVEPANAALHYSETLIRFERLPCYYEPFITPVRTQARAALDLPETGTLYGCPQSLFKFHPDFDAVLSKIAEGDPEGRIILIEGKNATWGELLRARWEKTAPILLERVLFLPRMSLNRFMEVMGHIDILLDPIHFGSGNTLYEAMVYGVPMVTWPGSFMRGRLVAGAYRQMGINNAPIAQSLDDYVEMALELGRNPSHRQKLRHALQTAAHRDLFADTLAVREFEGFLIAAVASAARGEKLPQGWSPSLSTKEI